MPPLALQVQFQVTPLPNSFHSLGAVSNQEPIASRPDVYGKSGMASKHMAVRILRAGIGPIHASFTDPLQEIGGILCTKHRKSNVVSI
jgi:hypothetical protein